MVTMPTINLEINQQLPHDTIMCLQFFPLLLKLIAWNGEK